ncbi:sulfur reduction protein DsrE [Enterobacterales bacterium CwR94]|nr:sulfur reduction protein DsrE [Enterobacterales bacterium CwR94]
MRSKLLVALIAGVSGYVATALSGENPQHIKEMPRPEGFWSTPAIEGYGKIHYETDVLEYKPTTALSNKIVIQLTKSEGSPERANIGLERAARMVNLYTAAGIPKDQQHIVVSITGDATPAVLNNQQFKRLYGFDNPSLSLIAELKKAGVVVSVCDQSVAFHHFDYDWIDKSVVHALSSPTTVSTLENQGYAFLSL